MESLEKDRQCFPLQLASQRYNLEYDSPWERAERLIEHRSNIEHDGWEREPSVNARTALFEELTAKGHLSRIIFDENPDLANQRTLRRLLNGWSDDLPEWEQRRRKSEIAEEVTIHKVWKDIQNGFLPADTMVITISNYPDLASETEATALGYGVLNKKGMVRVTSFEGGVRGVEQVSRSNSQDQSTKLFYNCHNLMIGQPYSSNFLANPIIATRADFPDGVIDVQRALDSLAGPNIIYGEVKRPGLELPEYEVLRQVSAEREERAAFFTEQLAEYEKLINVKYQAGLIGYKEKLAAINQKRKEIVDKICVIDPSYAKDARGEASVIHFEEAALAMAAGDDAAGVAHLEAALAAADPRAGAVCGGNGLTTEQPQTKSLDLASRLYKEAKSERRFWKWQKGICVVKECPTRPAKTEVGPCSVCRKCQKIFDKGDNPKTVYRTLSFLDLIFGSR